MPIRDPYGLRARIVALGHTNNEMAEILTERGTKASPASVSRAVGGDSKTHSSNIRAAIFRYLNEVENGKTVNR